MRQPALRAALPRRHQSNVPQPTTDFKPVFHGGVQFSKQRLRDFGELSRGEIPEALAVSPAHALSSMENGVRVFTEAYPDTVTTVSVFVKAGSRFEDIESSGASFFLQHLIAKGPAGQSRKDFEAKLQALGASIEATPGREIIGFSVKVLSGDVPAALELLLQAVTQPNLDANQIEADKELVYRKVLDVSADQFEHTTESTFYSAFRDHMMGQSQFGIRDNIPALSKAQLEEFHRSHFIGQNIAVVVTGQSQHAQVVEISQKGTQNLARHSSTEVKNLERPLLTGSVMFQRDDEMYNLNVGIAYLAPAFGHPDFLGMKIFEKVLGNYNANHDGAAHLNSPDRQYNTFHRVLGAMTGVTLQQTKYHGFSDIGLMTGLIHGNDFWGRQLMYINQHFLSYSAVYFNQAEAFRARAKLFNELLTAGPGKTLNEEIARELFYIGRRLTRTELAFRYSQLADADYLKKFAFNHFYDKDLGVAMWGPGHNVISGAYYDRRFVASTKADITNIL